MNNTKKITKEALRGFTGSMEFYSEPLFPGVKFTEGVKFLMDNGASWLVTDALAEMCYNLELKRMRPAFTVIKFDPFAADLEVTYEIECVDGKEVKLVRKYDITDLETPVKMYFTDNTLLLNTEY